MNVLPSLRSNPVSKSKFQTTKFLDGRLSWEWINQSINGSINQPNTQWSLNVLYDALSFERKDNDIGANFSLSYRDLWAIGFRNKSKLSSAGLICLVSARLPNDFKMTPESEKFERENNQSSAKMKGSKLALSPPPERKLKSAWKQQFWMFSWAGLNTANEWMMCVLVTLRFEIKVKLSGLLFMPLLLFSVGG